MLAFVDANVLAAPVPRTILYRAAAVPNVKFRLIYSHLVEAEAVEHQKAGHIPVDVLRSKHGWRIAHDPTSDEVKALALADTDIKDQPVLAAALSRSAQFLITGNVKHFGMKDLTRLGISAVHPGFFLAHQLSSSQYTKVIEDIGRHRQREPRTPLGIHETEIARELPQLFERHRSIFGTPSPRQDGGIPRLDFRGTTCVRCSRPLTDTASIAVGLGPTCRIAD
ncbi:MAG: PIN domain-containing protein [Cellulomonadaceae bacterium]|jgi:hypothetical protein|nr:PIN domain-containing protein [Cellulomonadaceae bacterium]